MDRTQPINIPRDHFHKPYNRGFCRWRSRPVEGCRRPGFDTIKGSAFRSI
ncbi:Hypothetical protein Bdt_3570 [Bdellovibrio bacteriovorus str. Tiberius]|uniref:Uncharacterized protein n=1 Tax=Bdellovibrio bacteriovorus str. Tiberius TaxID=1069642 RepID=K7Z2A4_BDEBC|nr:Hypothetical protein Bdt_3570 [Bdellovibrio bacteriovorus str. Tiberius]